MAANSSSRFPNAGEITLYIPCYEAKETIGKCLEGVLRQSVRPGRAIIVDDGSKEPVSGIPEVADAIRAGFPLELFRLDSNKGLSAARNKALELCRTSLIAALDSDAVPEPDWLERMLAAFRSRRVAGVGGRLDEHFQEALGDRWRAVHMQQHWGDKAVLNPRFLYGANTLFDASALRKAGGYLDSLRTNYEDMAMSERLRTLGFDLLYEPSAKCRHLRRDTPESALQGLWKWFHAKGLIQGDFNSPEGLLKRMDSVNFGIYRYRFDKDLKEGRTDFLVIDLALPWLFCALDLKMAERTAALIIPQFPDREMLKAMPEGPRKILEGALPPLKAPQRAEAWHGEYAAKFLECLKLFNWDTDKRKLP